MIKSLDNDSNVYLQHERLDNVTKTISYLDKHGTFLTSNLNDYKKMFAELHDFCQKHKRANWGNKRNIEAVYLHLMIPHTMSNDQQISFARSFAVKAFKDLPYAAYLVTVGQGIYVDFIISERRYIAKSEEVNVTARSDIYHRINEKGKKVWAKASDAGAYLVHKKGTVYRTYKRHFTNKDRLFTGNDNEFFHKIAMLKRIAVAILKELKFVIKRVWFKKINIKKADGNVYRYQNIRDLNDTFLYFEKILNLIEEQLLLGYMSESLPDLDKIKYTYLNRARNMRFKYGRVSLPFHYCMKRDLFRDNLEGFINSFDRDIDKFKQEWMTLIPDKEMSA